MKDGIHPNYRPTQIVCACGYKVDTRSTRGDFHVEVCSNCHPFFTGKHKLLDTEGRVEKFRKKYGDRKPVTAAPADAAAAQAAEKPKTDKAPKADKPAKAPKAEKPAEAAKTETK